jgi:hypothetical protein
MYATGHSYLTISDKVGISTWQVQRILSMINHDARLELMNMTQEIPLQFKSSIVLLRRVISVADQIQQTSKLESIKIGALHLMVDCNNQINNLLADSKALGETIDNALLVRGNASND